MTMTAMADAPPFPDEISQKVVAVGHDNEFGIKRMASVRRKFVPFPIRCSIVGARQTFRELSDGCRFTNGQLKFNRWRPDLHRYL